ncbi:MAG: DUF3737 family protein [Bacteroidales bacterium]|nr:DUF3737 family protein [Bacteroidales bacterium]MDY6406858.1 DUF3737 family protein [Bacteroidales bacterium]
MNTIHDQYFSGERPLYESRDLRLERVTIGEGESGLKESRRVEAVECRFEGMYVIWECEDVTCRNCYFAPSDRAPLWYCRDLRLYDCLIDAPKAFREIDRLTLERIKMTDGAESFWYCRSGEISDLHIEQGTYAFMHSRDLAIRNLNLVGKYVFQYARNIEIHNATLDTKDAFWNSENVTVYDSEIKSEYLGWYSKNLRLVRCRIAGTQPLCYAENLILEDCSFAPDADRAFEKSSVKATIRGSVASIVNPLPDSEIFYL